MLRMRAPLTVPWAAQAVKVVVRTEDSKEMAADDTNTEPPSLYDKVGPCYSPDALASANPTAQTLPSYQSILLKSASEWVEVARLERDYRMGCSGGESMSVGKGYRLLYFQSTTGKCLSLFPP